MVSLFFFSLLRFKISDFCIVDQIHCHRTLSTHHDIVQHAMTLRNLPGHCATYLGIAQHSKSKFWGGGDLITKIYNVLDGALTIKEGLPTFACKSRNADGQDWYIFF